AGLAQVEDQRLLDQEREAGADDRERRLEVALVGQADRDQVGALPLQHLLEGDARAGPELAGPGGGAFGRAADHRAEVHIGPLGIHPGVLASPPRPGAHHRNPGPLLLRHGPSAGWRSPGSCTAYAMPARLLDGVGSSWASTGSCPKPGRSPTSPATAWRLSSSASGPGAGEGRPAWRGPGGGPAHPGLTVRSIRPGRGSWGRAGRGG